MICPECGSDEPEGAGFCGGCGRSLAPADAQLDHEAATQTCASCGSEEPDGAVFCGSCGAPLAGAQAETTASAVTPAPAEVAVPAAAEAPTGVIAPAWTEASSDAAPPAVTSAAAAHRSVTGGPYAAGAPATPSNMPGQPRRWILAAVLVVLLGAGGAVLAVILSSGSSDKAASPPLTVTVRVPPRTVTAAAAPTTEPVATTAATTLAATPAPASAGLLPVESRGQMTGEIQTLLLAFHQDVVAHDEAAAWGLLSVRKQRQELATDGYAKWAAAQETLAPYLHPSGLRVRVLASDASSGVATVDVTGMKWSAPGARCTEWSGITWVKYESGTWTYDPGHTTTAARSRAWTPRLHELLGRQC